jgi:hypothetical protein
MAPFDESSALTVELQARTSKIVAIVISLMRVMQTRIFLTAPNIALFCAFNGWVNARTIPGNWRQPRLPASAFNHADDSCRRRLNA